MLVVGFVKVLTRIRKHEKLNSAVCLFSQQLSERSESLWRHRSLPQHHVQVPIRIRVVRGRLHRFVVVSILSSRKMLIQ